MRFGLATKISLLLIVSSLGAFISFFFFWKAHAEMDPARIILASRQSSRVNDLGAFAHMVSMGQEEDRAGLRERIAAFDQGLTVLERGGDINGDIFPRLANGAAAEAVADVRATWSELQPKLRVIAARPLGSLEFESAYRLHQSVIQTLQTQSDKVTNLLEGAIKARRLRILSILGTVATLSLVLLALGLWYASRFVVRPIALIGNAAKRLQAGDLSVRAQVPRGNELSSLAQTFNEMAAEVQKLLVALDGRRKLAEVLTDNMPIGTALLDGSLTVVRSSRPFQKLVQLTEAEILGRPVAEILPAGGLEKRLRAVMESGESVRGLTCELTRPEGARRLLRINAAATHLMEESGEEVCLVLAVEDVTEEERLRVERQAAQARLTHLIASSPAAIYSARPSGDYGATYVSENVITQLGYEPRDFTENPNFWADHVHPDDRQQVTAKVSPRPGHGHYSAEYRFRHKNGTYRWLRDESRLVRDAVGKAAEIVGSWFDITERKEAEKQFQLLLRAIEQSVNIVVITDAEGHIEYANPQFTRTTGYTLAEVLGLKPGILKSGETPLKVYAEMWSTIRSGKEWRGTFHNKKKNGELYWDSVTISPVLNPEGVITHFVGVQEDIDERKALEEQFRQSQKMDAVGQLAGGIAHDFNNLLTVVLGNLQLLEEPLKDQPETSALLQDASKAAWRGAELCQRILAFSRRQILSPESVAVNDLLQGMEQLLQRTLGGRVKVHMELAPDLPAVVVDSGQLENAILNLALNGYDAMPNGGTLSISTAAFVPDADYVAQQPDVKAGEFVVIEVSDTGAGMTPDVVARAFEPFFTTKETGKGSGLGLSMVYGFLKQSGGHARIYSESGIGTSVKLYFPAAPAHSLTQRLQRPAQSGEVRGGSEHILVVEDHAEVRRTVTATLSALGYLVLEADSGAAGLETLRRQGRNIDLLLSDMVMPGGMDGYELVKQGRALFPNLKVVLVSGYSRSHLHSGRSSIAGVAFLNKPFRKDELARVLRQVLDS